MAIKLNEVPGVLVRSYMAGVNTFLRGKPAIGKTETINAFAAKMQQKIEGFRVWQFYAPTMSPMDIQASAPNYETHLLEMFNNSALPNAYDTPDAKGVLFLGELPNADPATTKLLQKYVNGEDMSGVLRKPNGVIVVADGNRISDKSGVQQQGRAFMSRFENLEVYSEARDNIQYAADHSWHPYVQTFFDANPHLIDNYDDVFDTNESARKKDANLAGSAHMSEEGKNGIWANMRSWERISKKEFAAEELKAPVTLEEAVGNLGSGVGAAYDAHKKTLLTLASFEDIMANPDTVAIPTAMDERYALCMLVALRCKEADLGKVYTFGTRFPLELQAALLRHMATRKGFNLVSCPAYGKWISDSKLTALLNGR